MDMGLDMGMGMGMGLDMSGAAHLWKRWRSSSITYLLTCLLTDLLTCGRDGGARPSKCMHPKRVSKWVRKQVGKVGG